MREWSESLRMPKNEQHYSSAAFNCLSLNSMVSVVEDDDDDDVKFLLFYFCHHHQVLYYLNLKKITLLTIIPIKRFFQA